MWNKVDIIPIQNTNLDIVKWLISGIKIVNYEPVSNNIVSLCTFSTTCYHTSVSKVQTKRIGNLYQGITTNANSDSFRFVKHLPQIAKVS